MLVKWSRTQFPPTWGGKDHITDEEKRIQGIMRKGRDLLRLALLVGLALGVSVLHSFLPQSLSILQDVVHYAYVLPIIIAAISFGWRGGIGGAIFVTLLHGLVSSSLSRTGVIPLHLVAMGVSFLLVGSATGLVADREYRQKKSLEHKTEQLSQVYRQFQDNFEGLKRTERLYALGQLSAGLAHEVRNPLSSIEGAAAILQKEPGSEERRREFLQIIQDECRRLDRLLTNFLDFAKPPLPQYQEVDLDQLLDNVINLASHAIGRKEIALRKELAADAPTMQCDPEQLKQVILNLAINAIQAMPEGGEIILSARQEKNQYLIQVKDQGCGISEANLDKTFDPFFTTKENGTGLGLPVAHQIVSQHGGILKVERNPDRGMTFSVILPLVPGSRP
jgi:signal transduction histidine kinase